MGDVVYLDIRRSDKTDAGSSRVGRDATSIDETLSGTGALRKLVGDEIDHKTDVDKVGGLSLENLYPEGDVLPQDITVAAILLDESLGYMDTALDAEKDGDPIEADDQIQHFQALSPELFCCRTLGDGFGAGINAIHYSLKNLNGNPLNANQIGTIRLVLKHLRAEPFLTFLTAVELITKLERTGLNVAPPNLDLLLSVADD